VGEIDEGPGHTIPATDEEMERIMLERKIDGGPGHTRSAGKEK
jgi:hypothetical protein